MNASARLFGIGILAATGIVSAHAMDVTQQSISAGDAAPALTLPAFLDIARLPDMQDAWRHATAPVMQASKADDEVMQTAAEAMSRAEQINRDVAATRARAEELSRRFNPGGAEPADQDPGPAQEPPPPAATPTETASIDAANAPADAPLPPAAHVLGPADATVANAPAEGAAVEPAAEAAPAAAPPPMPKKKAAKVDAAPVIEDMATKPPKPAKRIADVASARQITQAATAKPTSPGLVVFEESPTQPEHDPSKMLPTELRAFGWNAQP